MSKSIVKALALGIVLSLPLAAQAQQAEPIFGKLSTHFEQPYFNVGLLAQAVADYMPDRPDRAGKNGFSLGAARLSVRGQLDHGFGYLLQTEFLRSPAVLDARISYTYSPAFIIDAGLYKAPFSAEYLIPAPSIDFVNRSQVVNLLAPKRQVGAGLRGSLHDGLFNYSLGLYNGNGVGGINGNNDNALLTAFRLGVRPDVGAASLEVAGNVASEDREGGRMTVYGADLRLTTDVLLVSGEFIAGSFEQRDQSPQGFQGTLGYMLRPNRHQLLLRLDVLDTDTALDDVNYIVLGYNFWPSTPFEFQVNYLIPTEENDQVGHQVLLNFQVAF